MKGYKVTSCSIWRSEKGLSIWSLGQKCARARVARVRDCPGLNHSQSPMDGNFAAFWPTDPLVHLWTDLNPLNNKPLVQEADGLFRTDFALSKSPLIYSCYLLAACKQMSITVNTILIKNRPKAFPLYGSLRSHPRHIILHLLPSNLYKWFKHIIKNIQLYISYFL